ncbi:MAG: TraR/DksA family transcriptional regulator [Nitrospiraceae bacterium]
MPHRVKTKKKSKTADKRAAKIERKRQSSHAQTQATALRSTGSRAGGEASGPKLMQAGRRESLHRMLMARRQEVMREIEADLGQSLTEDQQRRLESARDVGDQALMDLERELGISLLEMRNRKRQLLDEAIQRLAEGTYGRCAECGVEISEKRLAAVPFAKLCVECQAKQELLEKIEKGEERD